MQCSTCYEKYEYSNSIDADDEHERSTINLQ